MEVVTYGYVFPPEPTDLEREEACMEHNLRNRYLKEAGMISLLDPTRNATVELEETERQLILLALGKCAQRRTSWDFALGEIADKLDGRIEYEEFKKIALEIDHPKFEVKMPPDETKLEREI